jgi:anthranilate phosphoribosyltransferase
MMYILRKTIDDFGKRRDLNGDEAEAFLDALIVETDEPLLADIFRAWNEKGIAENEIYSIAKIMRDRCTKVNSGCETFVDIVGTGGSTSKTFNVSTAAAFVVAGAGIRVAKHGNKAATSNSGSADVLSALGIEPSVDSATAEKCLNEIGICFMFAPNFHRLSPVLAKVRRGLGFPTIFNCVGPLCNPANAPHQLIGVWNKELVPKMANALSRLGTNNSWVVHGNDGLDEITLNGPTTVAEITNGSVQLFDISPEDFGVGPSTTRDANVTTAEESAILIRDVLGGKSNNQTAVNLVAFNAAAAFCIVSDETDLPTAHAKAIESINNGAAQEKLKRLVEMTNR